MLYQLVIWGGLLALLAGCAATAVREEIVQVSAERSGLQAVVTPTRSPLEDIDQRAYQNFVNGLLLEGEGDLPGAAESFRLAWKYCPSSAVIGTTYAQALVHLRQFPQALQVLERVTPKTAEMLALAAFCYRQTGDSERAKETYLEMVSLDSTKNVGYMYLASYYRQHQNADSLLWALKNLARTLPENHDVQNELARAYVAKGDFDSARDAFRRSMELQPVGRNAETIMNLADLFERSGQPDSVKALFEDAIRKDPHNAIWHRELARRYLVNDSIARALPYLWSGARLSPQDFSAQRQLAIVLISTDSLAVADSILTSIVSAGDPDPATHFYLGRIGAIQQNYPRARDEFRLVTERAPLLPEGWLSLGFAYRRLGQPEAEIETYQNGLLHMREEKDAVQLYFSLGAAYEQAGMVDSAVAAFETILEHNPEHGPSLNYLGYTLADRGLRLEYARDLLSRAVKLEPNNAAYLDSYGWVFYRLGAYDEAIHYLQAAAALDSDPVIYDHLGDALQAIGETDQAREWWKKALERQPDNEAIKQKLSR
ncbi:MAG: tetratricopeptide repeat protein [Candidatus Zixiibacteriota bacterium]